MIFLRSARLSGFESIRSAHLLSWTVLTPRFDAVIIRLLQPLCADGFGLGFTHGQGSGAQSRTIQAEQGLARFFVTFHLNERETARTSSVTVLDDVDGLDCSVNCECIAEF